MMILEKLAMKLGKKGQKGVVGKVVHPVNKLVEGLKKESKMGPVLHQEVLGALRCMQAADPSLEKELANAYGYAVFPRVGKATLLLGGTYGTGEVFERARVVGYAGLIQLTIGLQIGGQTVHELLLFHDRNALEQFKAGKISFAANASAVIVKAGAAASTSKTGTKVFVHSEGGMMLEAAIGGQKFVFKPAVLGRLKSPGTVGDARQASKLGAPTPPP